MEHTKLRRVFLVVILIHGICIGLYFYNIFPKTATIIYKSVSTFLVQNITRTTVVWPQNATDLNASVLAMIERIERADTSSQWVTSHPGPGTWNCSGSPSVYKGVENLLCMSQPKFLQQYKNPCWKVANGGQSLTCLPYFQVIGMDKSGSTDLFDKITQHPYVLNNTGVIWKETQWWSWRRYGHFLYRSTPIESFKTYLRYFRESAATIQRHPNQSFITGDGTPMDVWDMTEWDKIPQNDVTAREPTFTTADLIHHLNPAVKLLIIFRNPVERLFSDYFFLGLGNMSVPAFHRAVVQSIQILHGCTKNNTLRSCIYDRELTRRFTARIHLGFYPLFLKDWFRIFPRHQFFITRTEDYSRHPEQTLREAFTFLDMPSLSDEKLTEIAGKAKKHVTQRKKKAGSMLPGTRSILERLYLNFNEELAVMLKDRNYLWRNVSSHGG